MPRTESIYFWRVTDPHGEFCQWYPCQFQADGKAFTTTEQFMMYHKALLFGDEAMADRILATNDPRDIKRLGREVQGFNEGLWLAHREDIVTRGNIAKFSQSPELKQKILSTGEAELVEASPVDKIWGIGLKFDDPRVFDQTKWKGLNLLGKCLMAARRHIRAMP